MDPLSIAAAVVGLLAATGQVYGLLEAISSARNSPSTIESARVEIRHTEIALRSLQGLLERLETTESRRRRLVQIDDLRITFSDAILEFAAFESFLEPLPGLMARHSVTPWSRHAKKIEEHLVRIGRHKTSLMVILSILQWYVPCRPAGGSSCAKGTEVVVLMRRSETDAEAVFNQQKLHLLVETVLAENVGLRWRLLQSEDYFDACSIVTRHHHHPVEDFDDGKQSTYSSSSHALRNSIRGFTDNFTGGAVKFAFESVLEQSRVYRNSACYDKCDRSFTTKTTVRRTHAWSIFSGYSLAEISLLSVIAMPLLVSDISNSRYYTATSAIKTMDCQKDIKPRNRSLSQLTSITEAETATITSGDQDTEAASEELIHCKSCTKVRDLSVPS